MGEVLIFRARPGRRLSPELITGPRPALPASLPDPLTAFETFRQKLNVWQMTGARAAEDVLRYSYWVFVYAFVGVERLAQ